MNERTKIDVSLDTFGGSLRRNATLGSINLFQSQLAQSRALSDDLENERQMVLARGVDKKGGQQREDKEAELETLRSVKIFLTDKLKQNEQVTVTFQQDIEILKEVLRVDKQIAQKTQAQLKQRDADIKELRQEFLESEKKLRDQVNTLSLK